MNAAQRDAGWLTVSIPVVIGATTYLAWRSPTLLLFHWLDTGGLLEPTLRFRAAMHPLRNLLSSWVIFSLPDALWTFAMMTLIFEVWRKEPPSPGKTMWCATAPVLAVGGEIGQALGVLSGTFDMVDLVLCALAAACAVGRFILLKDGKERL